MTGNRTTELLRKLLSKRGVESRETMSGNVGWTDANGEDVVTLRSDDASGLVLLKAWLTPEQAISATLTRKTEEWLLDACNRATSDYVAQLEELVQDWQALYEEPDYGDCYRLRKRMQELGIEVIDE